MPIKSFVETEEAENFPNLKTKVVLFFWANWYEPSKPGGQMDQVLTELAIQFEDISFFKIEAEACPIISSKYAVEVVPTFVFLEQSGKLVGKVEGANPAEVASSCRGLSSTDSSLLMSSSSETLEDRMQKLINSAPVMLFMKGDPSAPKCKFSRQAIEILQGDNIQFGTFDILKDEEIRQGLKVFSNWPTYPQLYVRGELIGGIDVLKEIKEAGNSLLVELGLEVGGSAIEQIEEESTLEQRLKSLISSSKVMLFMKGNPEEPKCGFSRKITQILKDNEFVFSSFDILSDEEVRQGLKKFSNWPTYPQLYIDGELIGGLDIVEEMASQGELQSLNK